MKDAKKRYNKFIKKNNITDEGERMNLARALGSMVFIENQLMYAYANMNKTEDRITVKDIENAQSVTGLKAFFKSGKTIRATYDLMKKQIMQKTVEDVKKFQQTTGLSYEEVILTTGLTDYKEEILAALRGDSSIYIPQFTKETDDDLIKGIQKKNNNKTN